MGLDMYAYRIKGNLSSEKKPCINPQPEEFFYWRKNRHLNNVMKNIFIRKYGRNEEFNCRLLNLDSNDLDYIENLIRSDRIEEYDAPGLFFGDNNYDEEAYERDLVFIRLAREVLASGDKVYYYCSWSQY